MKQVEEYLFIILYGYYRVKCYSKLISLWTILRLLDRQVLDTLKIIYLNQNTHIQTHTHTLSFSLSLSLYVLSRL